MSVFFLHDFLFFLDALPRRFGGAAVAGTLVDVISGSLFKKVEVKIRKTLKLGQKIPKFSGLKIL